MLFQLLFATLGDTAISMVRIRRVIRRNDRLTAQNKGIIFVTLYANDILVIILMRYAQIFCNICAEQQQQQQLQLQNEHPLRSKRINGRYEIN